MTEPNTQWTATEPGVLVLPTTKFEIHYKPTQSGPVFYVYWDGSRVGSVTTLKHAKEYAANHMAELIEMGYEV